VKLWLVRHAATLAPAGQCYGRLDIDADPAATETAAEQVHRTLPPHVTLRTSPARRCLALAQALQQSRPGCDVQIDPRLQEMDFGAWEGHSWDAIGEPALSRWTADFARHAPGGGESVTALLDRVASALDDARVLGSEQAWITHAGVIRAARLLARGVRRVDAARDWPDGRVPFGGVEWIVLA
jgi:alpha-ribazole phosphatase